MRFSYVVFAFLVFQFIAFVSRAQSGNVWPEKLTVNELSLDRDSLIATATNQAAFYHHRVFAIQKLGENATQNVEVLRGLLKDNKARIRLEAAHVLGGTDRAAALDVFLQILAEGTSDISNHTKVEDALYAAEYMAGLDDPSGYDFVVKVINAQTLLASSAVARMDDFHKFNQLDSVTPVTTAMGNAISLLPSSVNDQQLICKNIISIGFGVLIKMKDQRSLPFLEKWRQNPNADVALYANYCIDVISGKKEAKPTPVQVLENK